MFNTRTYILFSYVKYANIKRIYYEYNLVEIEGTIDLKPFLL